MRRCIAPALASSRSSRSRLRRTSRSSCWRATWLATRAMHFLGLNRLGDVVRRAELEARDLVGDFAERRQEHDDRVARGGIALERAADLEAVELGHHHVEQDQIGVHAARDVERGAAVLRREQAVAAALRACARRAGRFTGLSSTTRIVAPTCGVCRTCGRNWRHAGTSSAVSWLLLERRGQPEQRIVIERGGQRRDAPAERAGASPVRRQLARQAHRGR